MAMMRALSSGVAGLKAQQTGLDVIGNNIANVNTYGFKASRTLFSDVLYQNLTNASAPGVTSTTTGGTTTTTDTGAGGINPSQVGYGAQASSVSVDTGRAGMSTTGYSGDCYIDGEGYFVVSTTADSSGDPSGIKYTRVGALTFDSAGYLVDGNGNRVLGATNSATDLSGTVSAVTSNATPDYIHYDPTSVTLSDISIAADGTITATESDGTVAEIGQIALAHFTNPAGLQQDGNNYYSATSNSGTLDDGGLAYGAPGDESTGSLVTGALESSNVDLANEFSNMITTERGYQANSKIITVADTMLETLVNMIR